MRYRCQRTKGALRPRVHHPELRVFSLDSLTAAYQLCLQIRLSSLGRIFTCLGILL